MATRMIEKVQVLELTKWGYKDALGFVNFSKTLSENDRAAVIPGATFEAELYVSDPTEKYPQGTRYLNKIVARTSKVEAPKNPASSVVPKRAESSTPFVPKFEKKEESAGMTKAEWSAKDRSQLIGGLSHDAAALAAVFVNVNSMNEEQALKTYGNLLKGMLEIREGLK